jgi:anaerobic selenocysteine-containing dehydrogenase
MNAHDASALGVADGDRVTLRSRVGEYSGSVFIAPLTPRNLQVHWPEGSVLIGHTQRSPESGVPDYNAVVTVTKA